jgi:hypothetical protein
MDRRFLILAAFTSALTTVLSAQTDPARQLEADLRAANAKCRSALEAAVADAPTACAEVVTLTERLGPDRRLERRGALRTLATAFFLNNRYADARVQMERAIVVAGLSDINADAADDYRDLAMIQVALKDFGSADATFARAVRVYETAIVAIGSPVLAEQYRSRLRQTLVEYIRLKRSQGDTAGAAALEAKLAAPLVN